MFAGTYVIQERVPARRALPPFFAAVPAPLAGWARTLQVSRLSDQTAEAAGSYLRRFGELSPAARDSLGAQLANAVAAQVSPPPPAGTPPTAYLAAVLAVRRERDQARFAAQTAPRPPAAALPTAAPPVPPPPALHGPGVPSGPETAAVDSGPGHDCAARLRATRLGPLPPGLQVLPLLRRSARRSECRARPARASRPAHRWRTARRAPGPHPRAAGRRGRLRLAPVLRAMPSARAWTANEVSMTAAGLPSAATRFTTRPSASRISRRPSARTYSSACGRTAGCTSTADVG